ncbi:MAG: SRPBCC family protein [Nitrosarchaeum sp.]|nr:SRPBCC family protein [Nitrosarchaeum sp.]
MVKKVIKSFHTDSVKKTITINSTKEKVWQKISNIVGLPLWVVDVKKTTYLSKKKRKVGTIRKITFADGNTIEEHVVAWKEGEYFTYIATYGLPLRAYVATLSIKPTNKKNTHLTWQSYFNSKKMTKKQFVDFVTSLETFYETSLENLKKIIEK